jgi:PTH2 family peptidyl-tRNA hydrolase
MDYKQVIIVRNDLKMPKGKLAAQVSHASVEAVLRGDKGKVKEWKKEGMKKIILKVDSLRELHKYNLQAKRSGLTTAVITDAGKTFFKRSTVTCVAIGPDEEQKVDEITGNLKMV